MIAARGSAEPSQALALARVDSFRLGALEVRPPTREVVGENDTVVLEPRVMQVLVLLAARRGKVVSRADLIDECWAGRVVGDDAINRCIQAIRRLADCCGGFSIRTVARVGYRLDEDPDGEVGLAPTIFRPGQDPLAGMPVAQASERRRLTILCCSPVLPPGATLDPEVKYDISAQWRRMVAEVAAPYGAFVDTCRGERTLACFGYPEAQEDAAERAVRAGLAIVDAMVLLNARLTALYGAGLSVRIGIHADLAVVGRRPDGNVELFGAALDGAERVEAFAQPDTVTITDAVRNSVPGRFVIETIAGADSLDATEAGSLHLVRSPGLASEGRPRGERSNFVGREEELSLLVSRWRRLRNGAGQLVMVHGEPGIGKSRLVEAFRETIASDPHLWIECRGEQLFTNTPLHASVQMLWQGLGWRGDESPEERTTALERAVERSGMKLNEAVPLLTSMLGLPLPDHYSPLLLAPEQFRRRLLATLAEWLFSGTRLQPLVLVIEDLHWLDPSSLELLHTLAEQGAGLPLMLLCTARPEFHSAWPARSHHIQVALGGLLPAQIRTLVHGLATGSRLEGEAVDAIVERADGIPLFAEALAKLVRDGAGAAEIPATLMDSLAARLDHLGGAREVAQIGAVIGRSFSWGLLRQLRPDGDEELLLALQRLVEAGIIQAHGAARDPSYRFRHALVREAAYGLMLTSKRREWHRRVAEAIAAQPGGARPEELAHHWTEAGSADQAIASWAQAGASAYRRHAFAEAAAAYRNALGVLKTLPETAERDALELEYSTAYSLAQVPAAGVQSPEITGLAARHHELAQRSGDIGRLVTARTYSFLAATFRGEWMQARQVADQVMAFSQGGEAVAPHTLAFARAMGHFCHFTAAFYRGEFPQAEDHFRKWEALSLARQYEERAAIAMAFGNGAILAWHLNNDGEATRRMACAHAHAEAYDSPFDRCTSLMIGALLNIFRRDAEVVERLAGETVVLARQWNFAQVEGWAGAALGWARAQLGSSAEGVAMIRANLLALAKSDTRVSLPFFLTMLAEAQALHGDTESAFESLSEALGICPPERQYRPYTLTCLGEISAKLGLRKQAEAAFRDAIATAELMGAKASKQRAVAGLGKLRTPRRRETMRDC